jgi:triphosphoribosyl-dephospho-CoA synthase
VRDTPTETLLEAMRLAARRDRVARQYATGFADIFTIGVPVLEQARADGVAVADAASRLHMIFLRRFADSHLARKFGAPVAASVRREAKAVPNTRAALLRFDRSLKQRGLNPGTTADLVVASLLAWRLAALASGDRDRPGIEPSVVQRRRHQRADDSKPAKRH